MEASTILNMVEYAFYNRFFIIDIIVSDDDSTMRAVLKHPSKGARVHVLKSSKGKLHEDIPEPSFLADPSHRVKVVAKHIFSIVKRKQGSAMRVHQSRCPPDQKRLGVHDKKE